MSETLDDTKFLRFICRIKVQIDRSQTTDDVVVLNPKEIYIRTKGATNAKIDTQQLSVTILSCLPISIYQRVPGNSMGKSAWH